EPWLIELYEHNPQFHPARGKAMNWKGDPAQARAGALFEYGSHVVDLAGWLVGAVRRVSTSFARVLPGARLDDIATLQLQFDTLPTLRQGARVQAVLEAALAATEGWARVEPASERQQATS